MKTFLLLFLLFILITAVSAQQTKVIYTCIMHPEVQMSKPGNCPKCGMTLVKKTIKISAPKPAVKKKSNNTKKKEALPLKKEQPKTEVDTNEEMHDHDKMNM